MADLIRELAFVLDRPVLDKTEYTGEFDLKLSFTRDETDPNLPTLHRTRGTARVEAVPAQGMVEVLVIDHVERPA